MQQLDVIGSSVTEDKIYGAKSSLGRDHIVQTSVTERDPKVSSHLHVCVFTVSLSP